MRAEVIQIRPFFYTFPYVMRKNRYEKVWYTGTREP